MLNLFEQTRPQLKTYDAIIQRKLKYIYKKYNFLIYENKIMYHKSKRFFIPLIATDTKQNVYIFETLEHSYYDLKYAKERNIQIDMSLEDIVKTRLDEFAQAENYKISHYILFENIKKNDYHHLNKNLQLNLKADRIIFNDSSHQEIIKKIMQNNIASDQKINRPQIISSIFIQYSIYNSDGISHFATKEQIDFIDSKIEGHQILSAIKKSGKTSSIVLKAIFEKLKDPKKIIMIIKPTKYACSKIQKNIENIQKYSRVDINTQGIIVVTPIEIMNMHLLSVGKKKLEVILSVDSSLMKKKFYLADLLICDDANQLSYDFLKYLMHVQEDRTLLFVGNYGSLKEDFHFSKSFQSKDKKVLFVQGNQHAKTMQIINQLLKSNKPNEILIVSDNLSKRNLKEDLEIFANNQTLLFDSTKYIYEQELQDIRLLSYLDISEVDSKCVILLDIAMTSINKLFGAISIASDEVYIIYKTECENINKLKEEEDHENYQD